MVHHSHAKFIDFCNFCYSKVKKIKTVPGYLFSNAVKVMLFISDMQYYVPIKLCRLAGIIHLFKITGILVLENVKLKQTFIWDNIEIDWQGVIMTLNRNKVNLPNSVTVKV